MRSVPILPPSALVKSREPIAWQREGIQLAASAAWDFFDLDPRLLARQCRPQWDLEATDHQSGAIARLRRVNSNHAWRQSYGVCISRSAANRKYTRFAQASRAPGLVACGADLHHCRLDLHLSTRLASLPTRLASLETLAYRRARTLDTARSPSCSVAEDIGRVVEPTRCAA